MSTPQPTDPTSATASPHRICFPAVDAEPTRKMATPFRVRTFVALTASLLVFFGANLALTAPAHAAPTGPIPEYYQFCYDRTPAQQLTSRTGTTPKHWYKTAVAQAGGVSCKYMYAAYGGFWPKEKSVFYSWSQVCKAMGLGTKGSLDERKIPHCYR